jgi:hypothetical protein
VLRDIGMAPNATFARDLLEIGVDAGVIMMACRTGLDLAGDLMWVMACGRMAGNAFLFGELPCRRSATDQQLPHRFAAGGMGIERRAGHVARVATVIPRGMRKRHVARGKLTRGRTAPVTGDDPHGIASADQHRHGAKQPLGAIERRPPLVVIKRNPERSLLRR